MYLIVERARQMACALACVALAPVGAAEMVAPGADGPAPEAWNAKFQSTYVWQGKRPFAAAYTGGHSLTPEKESSYSFTATAMLGWRPWAGGELYFNPEAAQGVPLSGLTGLGGYTNGEMARSSGPELSLYHARLFGRQTWGRGGGQEAVESGPNQLAGRVDKNRWVLTAGNLAVTDIFDNNAYSHDPRSQFMNWAIVTHGAFDFAADARGYSWGAALEWYQGDWVLRAGRFIQPKLPNEQVLDAQIFRHYGDQIELEHAHLWAGQPGKLRLLAFRNRTRMSRYQDALDAAASSGQPPSIDAVRNAAQIKWGLGLNLEQALSPQLGAFARASWADGKTETYAYTEIDASVSAGLLLQGHAWGRAQDRLGVALARNGLSREHRQYLASGGEGFFLGDGRLNYRPEVIVEAFYNWSVAPVAWLTLDWQHIRRPGYNADRGPVQVLALRLHTEF